uniref:Uncharacterized protein n=1 Tax=Steinernema glaseri TaxID=37863 RepID=A0A1I8AH01_9BILA
MFRYAVACLLVTIAVQVVPLPIEEIPAD